MSDQPKDCIIAKLAMLIQHTAISAACTSLKFGRQKGENVKMVDKEVGMQWRGGSTDGEGCSNDKRKRKRKEQ